MLPIGKPIPFVIEPATDGIDLSEWANTNRQYLDELLTKHRALLFRNFAVKSVADFERFVAASSHGKLLEYRDRTTPRTTKGNRIYTSTVHPADQKINLHNEGTYWLQWALQLYFCCLKPAERGGATPIADVRKVYEHIHADVRQRFIDKKMMLVRNYNDGFGLPWQEVYQTDDKNEVERYCRENSIEFRWTASERLQTRQVRPAVRKHPKTGEPVWFNHAAFFHYTSLEPMMRDALLAEFGEEGLPYNTYYGDGTPIEPEVAEHIHHAYEREKVIFDWQQGDIMLLDNMSIAHGRESYVGEREVIVCMTDAVDGQSM